MYFRIRIIDLVCALEATQMITKAHPDHSALVLRIEKRASFDDDEASVVHVSFFTMATIEEKRLVSSYSPYIEYEDHNSMPFGRWDFRLPVHRVMALVRSTGQPDDSAYAESFIRFFIETKSFIPADVQPVLLIMSTEDSVSTVQEIALDTTFDSRIDTSTAEEYVGTAEFTDLRDWAIAVTSCMSFSVAPAVWLIVDSGRLMYVDLTSTSSRNELAVITLEGNFKESGVFLVAGVNFIQMLFAVIPDEAWGDDPAVISSSLSGDSDNSRPEMSDDDFSLLVANDKLVFSLPYFKGEVALRQQGIEDLFGAPLALLRKQDNERQEYSGDEEDNCVFRAVRYNKVMQVIDFVIMNESLAFRTQQTLTYYYSTIAKSIVDSMIGGRFSVGMRIIFDDESLAVSLMPMPLRLLAIIANKFSRINCTASLIAFSVMGNKDSYYARLYMRITSALTVSIFQQWIDSPQDDDERVA